MSAVDGAAAVPPGVELDHLVIVAQTLAQGVQWCEAVLGITPGPGGTHARMGTHNRLFSITGPTAADAFAEIIAIDPAAPAPAHRRWFEMDNPALQAAVAQAPRLVHAVVRTTRLEAHRAALQAAGVDPGAPIAMSRASPRGELRGRLTLPEDGGLRHGGAVPTLIEWDGPHPGGQLPASGVQLLALQATAPDTAALAAAYAALDWRGVDRVAAPEGASGRPGLHATLQTPRGRVTLSSDWA
jgi:hypothetical protein